MRDVIMHNCIVSVVLILAVCATAMWFNNAWILWWMMLDPIITITMKKENK